MPRLFRHRSKMVELPPGTAVYIGDRRPSKTRILLTEYNRETVEEREISTAEECLIASQKSLVTWIAVEGLDKIGLFQEMGDCFQLHPLVIEDVLNTTQRPKLEQFEKYIFLVIKIIDYSSAKGMQIDHLSLILGSNYLISFHERENKLFTTLRERIKKGLGIIRDCGSDFLAYSILDIIVKSYFRVIEELESRFETLEDRVLSEPSRGTLREIQRLKDDIVVFRKSIWPIREVIGRLEREKFELIQEPTLVYVHDLYENIVQVIETIETFRDKLPAMLQVYYSAISSQMDEVMKLLTVIATIFIPLSLLASVFSITIPLPWPIAIGALIVIMVLMLLFFRTKRWI